MVLADYGADVVRVEPPEWDPWRDGLAVPYSVYNRNKRSMELDLGNENGREALLGCWRQPTCLSRRGAQGSPSATRSELRGVHETRAEAGLLLDLRFRGRVGL